MKRCTGTLLIILALAAFGPGNFLFAQAFPLPVPAVETEPQFALSLLDDYFKANEASNRQFGAVFTAVGGGIFALGAAGGVYSFLAPASSFSSPEEQMIARGASVGVAGLGALFGGIGILTLAQPRDKYMQKYVYLYAETDPVVQEALAYGIMKDLADEAKRGRITSGIIGIATPLTVIAGQAIISASSGDWDSFYGNTLSSIGWTLPNLVSGLVMLVGGTSREERLLETYRATSGAYTVKKK